MKKIIVIILLFLIASSFQFYQTNADENDTLTLVTYKIAPLVRISKEPSSQEDQDFENALDKIECELYFNKSNSVFKMVEKLDLENDFSYKLATNFASGTYYTDLIAKIKIEQIRILGE